MRFPPTGAYHFYALTKAGKTPFPKGEERVCQTFSFVLKNEGREGKSPEEAWELCKEATGWQ